MRSGHRVWVIYRKELLEILRDRRTLTAMVVIPVVLYPLLMLGFLRAAESEEARLRSRKFVVEVDNPRGIAELEEVIRVVRSYEATHAGGDNFSAGASRNTRGRREQIGAPGKQTPAPAKPNVAPTTGSAEPTAEPRATFEVRVGSTPVSQLGDDVQLRVRVAPASSAVGTGGPDRLAVHITYNEVNINSRTAMEQMSEIFREFRDLTVRERVAALLGLQPSHQGTSTGEVDTILEPVQVEARSIATERQRGGWALGQIIPIILVLMTITGSIYPAIDLTAGERERGTLETLMATPVPPLQLILGKFLVVASLGMLTAFLNVASVGATMHFSGLTRSITQSMPVEIPLTVLPIVLLAMVPFSLLFAAILIAVCSFARTFKEAQSYVMPVILGAMIPAIAVTLPTARLSGIMLVLPVGNMVLLARELFQESFTWSQVAIVLISTTLYAAAAVAVAVRLFGQEAVVFADSGSYKTLLLRRYYQPSSRPTLSQAMLVAALLFPACFYAQSLVTGQADFIKSLLQLAVVQFLGLFVLLPVALVAYYRIDGGETFKLRLPPVRTWVAAVLLGGSSWALAQEFMALQSRLIPPSQAMQEAFKPIEVQLSAAPLSQILLLLAVIPAMTEEFFFRGFLLSGLSQSMRKWSAILVAALTFGIYHFIVDRVPVTAMMGVCLGYLCWQSRSILPGIVFHMMHNGLLLWMNARFPEAIKRLGLPDTMTGLLPARVVVPAIVLFVTGLAIASTTRRKEDRQIS
jgi:sodium transport system permease protein